MISLRILYLIVLCSFTMHTPMRGWWITDKLIEWFNPVKANPAYAMAGCSALISLYAVHKWGTTPYNPTPTLENVKAMTLVRNAKDITKVDHIPGIPESLIRDKEYVVLYVPPYNPSGRRGAFEMLERAIIPSINPKKMERIPCITFNFIDQVKSINLGQRLDQKCLDVIYKEIIRINPKVKIIIYGFCRGALTVLNYLSSDQLSDYSNIKTVILDEPLTPNIENVDHTIQSNRSPHRSINQLSSWWNTIYNFLKKKLPNRKTLERNILTNANFPQNIPIFIGYIPEDTLGINIERLIDKIPTKNKIQLFECKGARHGSLFMEQTFQKAICEFLQDNKLPYRTLD